ncbi:uncharacterized protein N7473_008132 [Penicillium subrubescens]|uniref:Centromere protein H C-terminal domain-containing protein n=1 Tax=Penicillium subrubescens TaxID=1316194 RepID=A0A1Q5TF54_9EURO|nr:uncharacterized protein N7473_008132 [Penicillium subrubescens]KAJ5891904.1 hypothetical protein N7473_008132 [Penicillium subrubescens]OKO98874.1 hypothetical protein PENSUB_8791 [Penicillium subrubescens]
MSDSPPPSAHITRYTPTRPRDPSMATKQGSVRPHLLSNELALLDYAADDVRDIVTLSDKEALVLQLAGQVQEQQLEKALLEQELESLSGDNVEEELAIAEREFLEARGSYTVRRKAARTILMTDPILKAVHLKATTPPERALLRLVNRRDVLALAQENLASAHELVLKQLSDAEVENLKINQENQELVRELLELTKQDSSWRERLQDADLASQLDQLEAELKKSKAKWETMKSIASAMVVGSGLDWADDDTLRALVLEESDD